MTPLKIALTPGPSPERRGEKIKNPLSRWERVRVRANFHSWCRPGWGCPSPLRVILAVTGLLFTLTAYTPPPPPAASLRQLTSGGCCVQPVFSPDSRQVLFLDKPTGAAASGIYGINLADPLPAPVLVNPVIGFRSEDRTLVATLKGRQAQFTPETGGQSWTIDTGGNWPRISPDNRRILWVATDQEGPYDRRRSDIWLADLAPGSQGQLLFSVYGGGFAGWFPDNRRLLFMGRDNPNEEKQTLFVYNLESGQRTNLFAHKRLRGGEISTGGSWISFFITFADNPAENGLWLINSNGATPHQLDLPRFGAYRWRNDDTLLLIPMREPGQASMQLWAINAATGQRQPLTNPDTLPFSISNGDWDVSPDGRYIVFVNSADQNLWLITLP